MKASSVILLYHFQLNYAPLKICVVVPLCKWVKMIMAITSG